MEPKTNPKIPVYLLLWDFIIKQPWLEIDLDGSEDLYLEAVKNSAATFLIPVDIMASSTDPQFMEEVEKQENRLKVEIFKEMIVVYQYR